MAGKTYTQKIQFKGSFDGAEVLSGLKKIRQSMSDAGADASLFKGVDKDIAATEKLINDMLAQIQKGFSNQKEVANFEKQLEKLGLSFSKINVGLQNINKAGNFNLNADEVKKYTTELERLTNQQERLKQAAQESIATQLQSAKLNAKERKAIMDEVEANGDLEAAVKKVAQAKEKAAKAKHGTAALDTETGKSFMSGVSGVRLDELGVTAKSGHSKKGRNDARERNARGILTGNIDEEKASTAALESYKKALEETIKTGGTATDAVEAMKKAMDEYGLELGDTSKLLESFDRDMQEFQSTALSSSQRGAISRAQTLGSTNANGEFELSEAGQALANNAEYQAMRQNIEDIAEAQENVNRATEEGTRQVERYTQEQTEGLNRSAQEQENLENVTRENTNALKEQSETAQAVNDKFEDMKGAVKTFLSIGSAISGVKQVIQQTFNDIKELDKSFAEIAMVTEYSVQQMWQSYDQYAEMANKLGQSTQSVIQASGLFYQQGLDTEESLALTEDTMKLATLAGLDFAEATSQMTAALRGFHLEMDEGARVTDVYSELAAKAAADVQGIAYAMSKTASIASSAGMEFETTSAFLTQMIETTQEAPENIGTAMKTIIARFTELKENVAGTADSEFDDLDYNKVDTALKSVGVSLKDTNGQFRDLDDVFLELSQKWNTLDRNSQRYIATIAAGSRQQSRFIAMMENYDRTIELVNTAYDSAGRASEQFAKYQDTVEYKMNQIQNSWEQLRTNFFDSDTYKSALDILKKFIDTLNNMDAKQFIGVGIIGITLGKMVITNFIKSLQSSTQSITTSFNTLLSTSIKKIKTKVLSSKLQNRFNESMQKIKLEAPTQALQQAGVETSLITQKNSELLLKYVQEKQQLSEIKKEMQLLEAKGADISEDELQKLNYLRQQTEELKKQKKETATQLRNSGITYDQIDQASRDQDLNRRVVQNQTLSNVKSSLSTAGKDALSSGITTALIMAISGSDFSTVIKTAGISALSAAIPSIISAVMPLIIQVLTGPVGIVAVIATAVIGGAYLITKSIEKANNAAKQAELNRLKNIEAINKDLEEKQINALQKANNAQTSLKQLNSLISRFEFLSEKSFLNTQEQNELSNIKNTLNNDYSDIVLSYDDNTEEIKLNTLAIEKLTETYEQEQEDAIREAKFTQVSRVTTTADAQKTAADLSSKYNEFYEEIQSVGDYSVKLAGIGEAQVFDEEGILQYSLDNINLDTIREDLIKGFGSDSELYKTLGIKDSDLDSLKTFDLYLQKAELSLSDFVRIISDASNEEEKRLEEEKLKQAREGVSLVYQTYTDENGETYSEELARSLSYGINEEDLTNTISKNEYRVAISLGKETNKNFLRDYLQAIQKGKSVEKSGGVSDALAGMQVTTDKSADDIIRDKMAEWKENEEYLMDGSDGNLSEWSKLPAEMVSYLESQGYTEANWNDIRKNASKSKEAIDGYFYNLFLSEQEAFGQLSEEQLSANQSQLTEIQKVLSNSGDLTQQEYLDQLTKIVTTMDEEVRNSFLAGQGLKWENGQIIETGEIIQDSVYGTYTQIAEKFSNDLKITGTENLSLNIQENILKSLESANLSSIDSSEFGQKLIDFFNNNNLSIEAQKVLSSIDFSQSYSELMMNSQSYIDGLEEAGISTEKATQIFTDYIAKAKDYIFSAIQNIEGVEILRENINDNFKNITENYSALLDAQEEFFEKGELSSETYYKLLEEGFDEYVSITSNGYELLSDKVANAYGAEAKNQYINYLNAIKEQKKTIEILKSNTGFNSLEISNNGETIFLETLKDAGEYYKDHVEQLEEYDGSYKQLIQDFINSGQDWDEYINNLEKISDTMENQKSDVYIQYLHTIADTYQDVTDEINELKEELEELNKQLEEDQNSLAEAEDELRQAIHGSDDFQSSLDGLVNYTGKIERLDRAIEKTKESLEDVANIDEAKGLMAQLSEQYKNKTITLSAENMAIDAALTNLRSTLTENYGDYISFDEEGNPSLSFAYMQMDANSELAKAFEEEYNLYEEYAQKKTDNLDTIEEIEKEKQEQREQTLQDFVSIQEDVVSILKDKAQEEIDITKDKYDALEEADNNYLDALQEAIDKQRQLRDQENQYEDLATKEKKLALMQRDTSGANQKETQQLEKEIEDDRQQLLDNEVDNLIESMRELYDKQKEARDAEIEYMEEVTENTQYFADWASNIMSSWQSIDDMQAWYLENDPAAQDMTVEQTEVYLNEIGDKYSDYLQYVAILATDFTTEQEDLNTAITEMYENTETNVENIGTVTQETAQATADKLIEEATLARDEAKDKLDETQQKITETEQALEKAEDDAALAHSAAMDAMVKASQEAMGKVSTYATKQLADMLGYDLSNDEDINEFAKLYGFINDKGEITANLYNAIRDAGGDISKYKMAASKYEVFDISSSGNKTSYGFFDTEEAAKAFYDQKIAEGANKDTLHWMSTGGYVTGTFDNANLAQHGILWPDGTVFYYNTIKEAEESIKGLLNSNPQNASDGQKKQWANANNYKIFKKGGLVNYTGPAWVDGTPDKPEAFLNPQDTARIGAAAELLANLPIFNSTSSADNAVSTNIGDTSIEIHINIENINDDYDVDQMIERVKQDIVDVSKPVGTSVILNK